LLNCHRSANDRNSKGLRKLGAALQALTLEGLFFTAVTDKLIFEVLLERLDQAILEVIDNPEKTQQTTAIGTLF
jgi:hypothetical protein